MRKGAMQDAAMRNETHIPGRTTPRAAGDSAARGSAAENAATTGTQMRDAGALECGSRRSSSLRIAASLVVLAAAAFVVAAAADADRSTNPTATASAPGSDGALYSVERNGLRYEFHAVMGTEMLTRIGERPGDAKNLARSMPEVAESMRAAVVEREGVKTVECLRERHGETIASLRRLGYL